jgi:hypothetical protein
VSGRHHTSFTTTVSHCPRKDRDDVAAQVAIGRLDPVTAEMVMAEAETVAAALDRGERWWQQRWDGWRPDPSWPDPA